MCCVVLTEVAEGSFPEEVSTSISSPASHGEGQGENVTGEKHVIRVPVYRAAGEAFVDHCCLCLQPWI